MTPRGQTHRRVAHIELIHGQCIVGWQIDDLRADAAMTSAKRACSLPPAEIRRGVVVEVAPFAVRPSPGRSSHPRPAHRHAPQPVIFVQPCQHDFPLTRRGRADRASKAEMRRHASSKLLSSATKETRTWPAAALAEGGRVQHGDAGRIIQLVENSPR
jgi:hypothetical protein